MIPRPSPNGSDETSSLPPKAQVNIVLLANGNININAVGSHPPGSPENLALFLLCLRRAEQILLGDVAPNKPKSDIAVAPPGTSVARNPHA